MQAPVSLTGASAPSLHYSPDSPPGRNEHHILVSPQARVRVWCASLSNGRPSKRSFRYESDDFAQDQNVFQMRAALHPSGPISVTYSFHRPAWLSATRGAPPSGSFGNHPFVIETKSAELSRAIHTIVQRESAGHPFPRRIHTEKWSRRPFPNQHKLRGHRSQPPRPRNPALPAPHLFARLRRCASISPLIPCA